MKDKDGAGKRDAKGLRAEEPFCEEKSRSGL